MTTSQDITHPPCECKCCVLSVLTMHAYDHQSRGCNGRSSVEISDSGRYSATGLAVCHQREPVLSRSASLLTGK